MRGRQQSFQGRGHPVEVQRQAAFGHIERHPVANDRYLIQRQTAKHQRVLRIAA
ncbi:hypothetical protein D3C81_2130470 [compost metagenome]